jgi:dUTP pyrophosphatase
MANSIGLIDAGYTGHIIAVVDNNSDEDYTIKRGDRLFQLVSPTLKDIKVKMVECLDTTARGVRGFGSSGH